MITRVRIEGVDADKEKLSEEVLSAVGAFITSVNEEFPNGMWECTQDVISGNGTLYNGRMVMVFHKEDPDAEKGVQQRL